MWDKVKQTWDENPIAVIGAVGVAVSGLAALMNSVSAVRSRHAYARAVDYRIYHGQK